MAVEASYRIKWFQGAIRFELEVDDEGDSFGQQGSEDGVGCGWEGEDNNKNSESLDDNIKDRVVHTLTMVGNILIFFHDLQSHKRNDP